MFIVYVYKDKKSKHHRFTREFDSETEARECKALWEGLGRSTCLSEIKAFTVASYHASLLEKRS